MSEWNCGCIRPLPGVPRVRIVDEEGRALFEGYYIRHENRQPAVFGGTDYLHPEDVDHCVAVDDFADWNMPRSMVIKKVTPPHRIEVIGPVPGEACELEGDGTPEGEPLASGSFETVDPWGRAVIDAAGDPRSFSAEQASLRPA